MTDLRDANKKILLGAIAGSAVLVGLFGWLSYTDWKAIEAAKVDKSQLEQNVKKEKVEIAQIPSLEERILILREQVKVSAAVLPDNKEIHEFVDKMTEFASDTGVVVTKLDDTDARQLKSGAKSKSKDAFDRVTYRLSLDADFEQFMRFIDAFENKYARFVRIVGLNVRRDDNSRRDGGSENEPGHHHIDLELETYVYAAKERGPMVQIPGEEQKVERLRLAGRLEGRIENLDVYQYAVGRPRRDPLRDPRRRASSDADVSADKAQQEALLAEFKKRLLAAAESLRREESERHVVQRAQLAQTNNSMLLRIRDDLTTAREENIFTVTELAKRFDDEILASYASLVRGRDLDSGLGAIPEETLAAELRRMLEASEAGRYPDVVTIFDGFSVLRADAEAGSPLARFFEQADPLVRAARSHIEAASLQLDIGGLIFQQGRQEQAVAIINGVSFGLGEVVRDGLRIRTISAAEVVFDYKGITVVRQLSAEIDRAAPKKKSK